MRRCTAPAMRRRPAWPRFPRSTSRGGLKRLERHGLVFRDGDGLYRLASTNLDLLFELDQLEQNAMPMPSRDASLAPPLSSHPRRL